MGGTRMLRVWNASLKLRDNARARRPTSVHRQKNGHRPGSRIPLWRHAILKRPRPDYRLHPIPCAQCTEYGVEMHFHGGDGKAEIARDHLIGLALRQ